MESFTDIFMLVMFSIGLVITGISVYLALVLLAASLADLLRRKR